MTATASTAVPREQHRSELLLAWQAMTRDRFALAGIIVVVAAVLISIFAPWISPFDPHIASPTAPRLSPPLTPSHLLGTDGQGRDILSRVMWGGRMSLPIALAPILASSFAGLVLGLIAGYFRGPVSGGIMRGLDVLFAFPGVLLAVAVAAIMGPGMTNVMLAMSIVLLPYVTRIVYVETIATFSQDFIDAARVAGTSDFRILYREVLPNIVSPVIVFGTTSLGGMLVLAAGLSFLGVGIQPPTADWGVMASDGRVVLKTAPWVSLVPGVVIVVVAVACNFVGDALRDALDPRQRTKR